MSETIDRPKFRELRYKETKVIPREYDMVQLKMDGIWGCMTISDGKWTIHSRTGKLKTEGEIDDEKLDAVLLGEFMFGSHWGHKMGKNRNFYIFDCVRINDNDISLLSLASRLQHAGEMYDRLREDPLVGSTSSLEGLRILKVFPSFHWRSLWDEYIKEYGYEGLVFKNSSSVYGDKNAWARMKAVVEMDYVCVGFRDADEGTKYEGMVGSVLGTLSDKEVYVTCGGLTEVQRKMFTRAPERYIGRVFTAKGNNWYPSGAIRHPMFQAWRDDKEPEECTYSQIPEGIRCLT
jgi:ATP-dependent DNA ligase